MKQMISISEAADLLGVTTKTIRNWDKSGKLSASRTLGGHRRYKISDIQRISNESTGNICYQKQGE